MSNYRRLRVPGGTYFFTAHLADRRSELLVRDIDRLRQVVRQTMQRYPFRIDAIAVLPATIHTIWTLPEGDADFSNRWSMLKSLFSRDTAAPAFRTRAQVKRGEKGIWQRRFWEHLIRDAADFDAHVTLVHTAPQAAGLVDRAENWLHSSIHRRSGKASGAGVFAGPRGVNMGEAQTQLAPVGPDCVAGP